MAKKSIIEMTPEFFSFGVDDIAPIIVSATKTALHMVDFETEMEYTIAGKGLKVINGLVVGGAVEAVEITGFDGETVMAASRLGINTHILSGDSIREQAGSLLEVMFLGDNDIRGTDGNDPLDGGAGDDILRGRGGHDSLLGGLGMDVLIGGKGDDDFFNTTGMGRDVIRDFDLGIADTDRDFVDVTGADLRKSGRDTIIDYGDGDMFVLKNIRLSDFQDFLL